MHGPADWAAALAARPRASARILFARLNAVAHCEALSSSELAECLDMGGERGARYAIYLACKSIREAGEFLRSRGVVKTAFDITESIAYSDALAAAAIITRLSGGGRAEIRLLGDDEDELEAASRGMDGEQGAEPGSSPFARTAGTGALTNETGADARARGITGYAPGEIMPGFEKDGGGAEEGVPADAIREDTASASGAFAHSEDAWAEKPERETVFAGGGAFDTDGGAFERGGGSAYGRLAASPEEYEMRGQAVSEYSAALSHRSPRSGTNTDAVARALADRLRDAAGNV